MNLIDGKLVSSMIKNALKEEVNSLFLNNGKKPKLAVILVGNNPASLIYIRRKQKMCEAIGIDFIDISLPESSLEIDVVDQIEKLSADQSIDGILVQLPLPEGLDKAFIISHIPSDKDVDGLTSKNIASLYNNQDGIFPCTAVGVMDLLSFYNISLTGKRVCIIGRSLLVGKPLSLMMINANATVTLCHSKTTNLSSITKESDIIVAALGRPLFVTKEMVKPGAVVIDVGINRLEDGNIVGDVDFTNVKEVASYISPVPGGCGPMTVIELMKNTIKCYKIHNKQ